MERPSRQASEPAEPAAAMYERAYLARDARFDGRFFIGVRTTGVYCRPICPVRPPKVENVRFFASAAAAAEAGFRPCLRCRPEASPGTPAWVGSSAIVTRALRLIAEGGLDDAGVDDLASRLGVGDRHLRRLFLRHLGATPVAVAQTRRLHFAKKLLDETDLSMADVAFTAGFGSVRRFNAVFRETYGRSPGAIRRGQRGGRARRRMRPAGDAFTLRLGARPPFDFGRVVAFLGPRAIPGVERIHDGAYRRAFSVDGDRGLVEVRASAEQSGVVVRVMAGDPRLLGTVVERVRALFDLDADPAAISSHLRSDPRLRPFLPRAGIRIPGAWDRFETAVRAVLGQQITVRAATTLAGRLVEKLGEAVDSSFAGGSTGDEPEWRLFPRPEVLAGANLAALGMPARRAETLRRLARAVCDGRLRLDDGSPEEVMEHLLAIPGIGEWTASYVAMRVLREPDAFPAGDLGLRKALAEPAGAGPATEREVKAAAEKWRPWRAYAAMALWQSDTFRETAGSSKASALPNSEERVRERASSDRPPGSPKPAVRRSGMEGGRR